MIQLQRPYKKTLPYCDDMRKIPALIHGDTVDLFIEPIAIDGDNVKAFVLIPGIKGDMLTLTCHREHTIVIPIKAFEDEFLPFDREEPIA